MNFIHSILAGNYRKIFYESLQREDNDDEVVLKKPILVAKLKIKPSSYYHFSKTPANSEAVPFGLPHNRKWFLSHSRKHLSGLFYKKTEIASILRVLLFDLCGLSWKNVEQCIAYFDDNNPLYSRDSLKNFYWRPVKTPWFDDVSVHRLTVDVDGKYYKLKNMNNEYNDSINVAIEPKVVIECQRSFNSALNDHLTLYIFCRYLQQLLGPKVPRLIQIPMKSVFERVEKCLNFYKFVHKDKDYLFLDICPTVHDILVFQDFFRHLNNHSNNKRNN